jgi:hypothetical protein
MKTIDNTERAGLMGWGEEEKHSVSALKIESRSIHLRNSVVFLPEQKRTRNQNRINVDMKVLKITQKIINI